MHIVISITRPQCALGLFPSALMLGTYCAALCLHPVPNLVFLYKFILLAACVGKRASSTNLFVSFCIPHWHQCCQDGGDLLHATGLPSLTSGDRFCKNHYKWHSLAISDCSVDKLFSQTVLRTFGTFSANCHPDRSCHQYYVIKPGHHSVLSNPCVGKPQPLVQLPPHK